MWCDLGPEDDENWETELKTNLEGAVQNDISFNGKKNSKL